MTGTKLADTSSHHQPFLSEPQPQYVIVLPTYSPPPFRHRQPWQRRSTCLYLLILSLLLAASTYVLWPSNPELSVVRLKLDHLHFHTRPIALDVKLDLTVAVRNRDFYSIDYGSLRVGIGYKGNKLGFASSDGGRVGARGTSYVNATLELDGVEVLSDVIFLIEDLAKGAIAFDTVSEISGKLGVLFFDVPLKAKISCEVIVNTRNQTISRQNCYPQLSQSQ